MDQTFPFWAKCTNCKKVWEALRLPMEMREFGKAMRKAECPFCKAGASKIQPAKQNNGVLLEDQPV